jgi:hypothetical protein
MMTKFRLGLVFSLLAVFSLATSTAFANGIKVDLSASNKGVQNPDCASTILDNPACFQFNQGTDTQANWEAFSLTDFTTGAFTTLGPFDLFLVNGITAGTQVTLTLASAADAFGSFFCGDDASMTGILAGFCADPTDALFEDASGIFSQVPDGTGGAQQTFIFNGNAPGSWVFYATAGDATISTSNGTTSTAEPGTLLLLAAGAGLLALAKLRRG